MFRTISQVLKLLLALCIAATLMGCTSRTTQQSTHKQESAGQIDNPASENCVRQGGTLVIQKRGDGSEYGVCMFEDNRQCEEWALLSGDCPVGGRKITGYVTPAAQYCVITGGEYKITGNSNTDKEQGTCTFKNGQTCDVGDYFAGKCNPNAGAGQSLYNNPFTYCSADSIPAAVTGRATVYEWECKDGKPQVVKQLFEVYPQGYLADFCYEMTPEIRVYAGGLWRQQR